MSMISNPRWERRQRRLMQENEIFFREERDFLEEEFLRK
jgi:hypothetical protein